MMQRDAMTPAYALPAAARVLSMLPAGQCGCEVAQSAYKLILER